VGAAPKIGPISMDEKMVSGIWHEGEPFQFNFSKLWTMTRTELRFKEKKNLLRWTLVQETPSSKLRMQVTIPKQDLHELEYKGYNETGDEEKRIMRCGKSGIGRMKLYRKRLEKNKWVWELVDDINILDAGCTYGGVIPKTIDEADLNLEDTDIRKAMKIMRKEQKREIKALKAAQKKEIRSMKNRRKALEQEKRSYWEVTPDSDKKED
nr:hypothetical protein [Lachnospiraceae bacterium]